MSVSWGRNFKSDRLLGLTISKRLVEMMGGQIWVKSTQGEGSTFHFTAEFECQPQKDKRRLVLPDDLHGIKALVVDDSKSSRTVVVEILQSLTFMAKPVASGEEALAEFKTAVTEKEPYSMIFMDWKMPGMDGIETSRKMMEEAREMQIQSQTTHPTTIPKIVLMTAYGRDEVMQDAQKVGIEAFLIKPLHASVLFDTILDIFGKNVARAKRVSATTPYDPTDIIKQIGGARILLAEDNAINQQVAFETLESVGLVVELANNGREAVEKVRQSAYHAVLMDIQMPVMDGYEATGHIRDDARFKELPIIAMTAHALKGDREQCLASGMNDYVSKPFDTPHLFSTLVKWIKPGEREVDVQAILQKQQENLGDETTLGDLPGINGDAGLKRVGRKRKVYISLLTEFKRKYANAADDIQTILLRDDDLETARRQAHTIKGVAGNLGAQKLHEATHDLEQGIQEGDRNDWSPLLDGFKKELALVLESVSSLELEEKDIQPEVNAASTEDVPLDRVEVTSLLTQLYGLIEEGNSEAEERLDVLKKALRGAGVEDVYTQLEKQIISFDFDGAQESLVALARVLGIILGEKS